AAARRPGRAACRRRRGAPADRRRRLAPVPAQGTLAAPSRAAAAAWRPHSLAAVPACPPSPSGPPPLERLPPPPTRTPGPAPGGTGLPALARGRHGRHGQVPAAGEGARRGERRRRPLGALP